MTLADYAAIIRPFNCLMAAIACFAGYVVGGNGVAFSLQIAMAMAAVFLISGAGQAINDYFDRTIDAKLHPEKPVPAGRIKPKAALLFSAAMFILGIIISLQLPSQAAIIAIVFSILLVFYSAMLQKLKFIGNYVVALGTAFTIIFGASLTGNFFVPGILAVSAFFSNAAREIIKDLEDMNADRKEKLSLPMIAPKKIVLGIILVFYFIAIGTAFYPYYSGLFGNNVFLALVSVSSAAFLYSFKLAAEEKYGRAQSASKAAMAIALIGFISGAAL